MTGEGPYRFSSASHYAVVSLLPALNDAQWSEIEQVGGDVLSQLESLDKPLVVDLTELTYMGSSMVALIIRLWKNHANSDTSRFAVVNTNETVREVLTLSGLANVWSIVSSREEAESSLGIAQLRAKESQTSMLTVIGCVAATIAILGLMLSKTGRINSPFIPVIQYPGAALGMVVGLISSIKEEGVSRAVGVLLLVACIGVCVYGSL